MEVDLSTIPALSPNFSYAICVDTDGDFTSTTTHYPLTNTSGSIWSVSGVEPGGDSYFTICQYPTVPPEIALSIDLATIPEAAGVATVTATPTYAWFSPITVNLGYSGSSEPTDYTAAASIIIPARTASASTTVTAVQDNIEEPDESVIVDITSVTGASELGVQQVTTTIIDDDNPPSVTLSVDIDPIAENGGVATFTITLSNPSESVVTIDLGFSGSAGALDYVASGTQIIIPALSTTGSITVTAQDDFSDEPNETVIVDVTTVANGVESSPQQAQTTITDDDNPPNITLSVDLLNIPENGGVAIVTATPSVISAFNITVNLIFTGSTATLGTDYNPSAVSIFIPAGAANGTMTLTAVDDPDDDDGETIVVDIDTLVNANEVGVQQVTVYNRR